MPLDYRENRVVSADADSAQIKFAAGQQMSVDECKALCWAMTGFCTTQVCYRCDGTMVGTSSEYGSVTRIFGKYGRWMRELGPQTMRKIIDLMDPYWRDIARDVAFGTYEEGEQPACPPSFNIKQKLKDATHSVKPSRPEDESTSRDPAPVKVTPDQARRDAEDERKAVLRMQAAMLNPEGLVNDFMRDKEAA